MNKKSASKKNFKSDIFEEKDFDKKSFSSSNDSNDDIDIEVFELSDEIDLVSIEDKNDIIRYLKEKFGSKYKEHLSDEFEVDYDSILDGRGFYNYELEEYVDDELEEFYDDESEEEFFQKSLENKNNFFTKISSYISTIKKRKKTTNFEIENNIYEMDEEKVEFPEVELFNVVDETVPFSTIQDTKELDNIDEIDEIEKFENIDKVDKLDVVVETEEFEILDEDLIDKVTIEPKNDMFSKVGNYIKTIITKKEKDVLVNDYIYEMDEEEVIVKKVDFEQEIKELSTDLVLNTIDIVSEDEGTELGNKDNELKTEDVLILNEKIIEKLEIKFEDLKLSDKEYLYYEMYKRGDLTASDASEYLFEQGLINKEEVSQIIYDKKLTEKLEIKFEDLKLSDKEYLYNEMYKRGDLTASDASEYLFEQGLINKEEVSQIIYDNKIIDSDEIYKVLYNQDENDINLENLSKSLYLNGSIDKLEIANILYENEKITNKDVIRELYDNGVITKLEIGQVLLDNGCVDKDQIFMTLLEQGNISIDTIASILFANKHVSEESIAKSLFASGEISRDEILQRLFNVVVSIDNSKVLQDDNSNLAHNFVDVFYKSFNSNSDFADFELELFYYHKNEIKDIILTINKELSEINSMFLYTKEKLDDEVLKNEELKVVIDKYIIEAQKLNDVNNLLNVKNKALIAEINEMQILVDEQKKINQIFERRIIKGQV